MGAGLRLLVEHDNHGRLVATLAVTDGDSVAVVGNTIQQRIRSLAQLPARELKLTVYYFALYGHCFA